MVHGGGGAHFAEDLPWKMPRIEGTLGVDANLNYVLHESRLGKVRIQEKYA